MLLTLYQHSFVMIVPLVIFTLSVHVLTNIGLKTGKIRDSEETAGGRH